jgi:hypothetical protein
MAWAGTHDPGGAFIVIALPAGIILRGIYRVDASGDVSWPMSSSDLSSAHEKTRHALHGGFSVVGTVRRL